MSLSSTFHRTTRANAKSLFAFLLLRQADAFNGQEVILKLEERHGDTSHFREYLHGSLYAAP